MVKIKIKVEESNRNKINETIKSVEGKARKRLCEYEHVKNLVEHAENFLNKYEVPQKWKIGTKAEFGEKIYCNSYNNSADSTYIEIERFSSGWFLVSIRRDGTAVGNGAGPEYKIIINEKIRDVIIQKILIAEDVTLEKVCDSCNKKIHWRTYNDYNKCYRCGNRGV